MQTRLPLLRKRPVRRGRGSAGRVGCRPLVPQPHTGSSQTPMGWAGWGEGSPQKENRLQSTPVLHQLQQPPSTRWLVSPAVSMGEAPGPATAYSWHPRRAPPRPQLGLPRKALILAQSSFSGSRQEPRSLRWEAARPPGAKWSPNSATCSSSFSQGGSAPGSPDVIGDGERGRQRPVISGCRVPGGQ